MKTTLLVLTFYLIFYGITFAQFNVSKTDASCNGTCDGTAQVLPAGNYHYLWNTSDTVQSVNALCAGSYDCTVSDSSGTPLDTLNVIIIAPTQLSIFLIADAACQGTSNGNVNVTVSGGTPPYSYVWSNASTTEDISGLLAGDYFVTITDSHGCIVSDSVTLGTNPLPNASISPATANICIGSSITLTASGAGAGGSYSWSTGSTNASIIVSPASTTIYSVTVSDANGCTGSASRTVTVNASPTASVSPANPIICIGQNILLLASGAGAGGSYSWSNGVSAAGTTVSPTTTTTYSVTITDANGCTDSYTRMVNVIPSLSVSISPATVSICNGESATLTASGGVPPYSWSTGAVGPSITVSPSATSAYSVTVSLGGSCSATDSRTVIVNPLPVVSISPATASICNGGSVMLTANGGGQFYFYTWSPAAGLNTVNATIVTAAPNITTLYTVTVIDTNGCSAAASRTVDVRNVSADAGADFHVCSDTTILNGTTPPLGTGAWSVISGTGTVEDSMANNSIVRNLSAGQSSTFRWTVTDSVCPPVSDDVTITRDEMPTIADAGNDTTSCSTFIRLNANATVIGAGTWIIVSGVGTLLDVFSVSPAVSGLQPGQTSSFAWTIINGVCPASHDTVNVSTPLNSLVVSLSKTDVTCAANGSAWTTASGGTAPYTYAWTSGTPGITPDTVKNLSAGLVSVTVTDAAGCNTYGSITIANNSVVSVSISVIQQVSCFGLSDGEANAVANGGTAPYTYLWVDAGGIQNGQNVTNLVGGFTSVTATDATGCVDTASIIIIQPTQIVITGSTANETCTGYSDGQIDITISGGTPSYTFSWSNSSTAQDLNNLSPGTYNITVVDAHACTASSSFNILQHPPFTASVQATNATACGTCNGSAQIIANGGGAPYLFEWSVGSSSASSILDSLCPGVYLFSVTDNAGCVATGATIINSDTTFSLSLTSSGTNCNFQADTVTLTISQGNPPFDIDWADGMQDINETDSIVVHYYTNPGIYNITVSDSVNCFQSIFDTVTYTGISIHLDQTVQPVCSANNGKLKASGSDGIAPYTFSWSTGATIDSIENIPAGNYSVTVTDNSGCSATNTYALTQNNLGVTIIPVQVIQPVCTASNGKIKVSASGGIGAPYSYSWNNGATADSIQNIPAGSYNVTATDGTGCSTSATYSLSTGSQTLSAYATSTGVNCSNGTFGSTTVNQSGGQAPYAYHWNTNPVQNTKTATGLGSGYYQFTVTDANGCSATGGVTVQSSSYTYYVYVNAIAPNCSTNGSLTAAPTGGHAPYTYSWNTNPPQTTATITGLGTGSYSVTVTDNIGCQKTGYYSLGSSCKNVITGTVFNDLNNNCIFDVAETGKYGISVQASNGIHIYYGYTTSNGQFNINISESGTFNLSLYLYADQCGNYSVCGNPNQSVTFTSLGDTSFNNTIGLVIPPGYDLALHPGWNTANPGFEKKYWIHHYNQSQAPFTGQATLTFVYDSALIFQHTNPQYTTHDPVTHTLTWVVNSVPASCCVWTVAPYAYFTVPSNLPTSYLLHSTFTIIPTRDDCNVLNNHLQFTEPITSSLDPNEKEVSPAGEIIETDSMLTYTIHFQNTGNDTTHFIIVSDTLPPTVDPASVKTVAASHEYSEFKLQGEGILTWLFNPIFLPDSITDEAGSKGFVSFVVKKQKKMVLGTEIKNKASIYFDYNSSVETNTVKNTLVDPTFIFEHSQEVSVKAFPNPFTETTTIVVNGLNKNFDFSLYDIAGKELRKINSISSNQFEFKRKDLSSGIYFYRITLNGKNLANGKLIIE